MSHLEPSCSTEVNRKNSRAYFGEWTGNRAIVSLSTNSGSQTIPFQQWRNVKEAFTPELVARAINESPIAVRRCIDPFGGSGTTGLACQFLGVHPVIVEVNPYLADLTEAKLTSYPSTRVLCRDLGDVLRTCVNDLAGDIDRHFSAAPSTFVEPGKDGRWIFSKEVAERLAALIETIDKLDGESRNLFKVLLGGILNEVSNVVVSGKGRRYRRSWRERVVPPEQVTTLFSCSVRAAIQDICRFGYRAVNSYQLMRGDSRTSLVGIEPCELAVFSPPYPNSFDYTDVYNVELWTLGYLDSPNANSTLRSSTLSSHVQKFKEGNRHAPTDSQTLSEVIEELHSKDSELWDRRIPKMIGAYFRELLVVLDQLSHILVKGGTAWIIVGDSSYAGVQIPVGKILEELIKNRDWRLLTTESLRSMRTSAQQGGIRRLPEQLLVLENER